MIRYQKAGQPEKKTVNDQDQYLTTFEARCNGDRLSFYRDSLLLLTAQDSAIPDGNAGLGLWTSDMETNKPFTMVLSALNAKDLTGFTQDGMDMETRPG